MSSETLAKSAPPADPEQSPGAAPPIVVMALGFALGPLLAAGRLSTDPVLRNVSWYLLGPVAVAVIGLTLHEAAYAIEGAGLSVITVLRSVYPRQSGGPAAGYAVVGRGGVAVGQPVKRQPSLFGVLLSGGDRSLAPTLRPGAGATL